MNQALNDALAGLNLQPGDIFRTHVNGNEIELRVLTAPQAPVHEEPSPFADMVMLEPWFTIPTPPPSIVVNAELGKPRLPDPPIIPPDDDVE